MSKQTRNYILSTHVCLFFAFVHLSGAFDLGGLAIGIALAALVFAILAFGSSKKDRKLAAD